MSKNNERIIEVNKVLAFEIDKNKKYIICIDKTGFTHNDLSHLREAMDKIGFESCIAIMVNGDPNQLVKVIEYEPKTSKEE